MTKRELEMLTGLLEHEIFHMEGVVNAFDSKESNKNLRDLQAILEVLKKSNSQVDDSLSKDQKGILLNLIKQAQMEAQRVLDEQEKIKKIQQDSNTLNKLERSLYAT